MPSCQVPFSEPVDFLKWQICRIWHYKMPVSSIVLQLWVLPF